MPSDLGNGVKWPTNVAAGTGYRVSSRSIAKSIRGESAATERLWRHGQSWDWELRKVVAHGDYS